MKTEFAFRLTLWQRIKLLFVGSLYVELDTKYAIYQSTRRLQVNTSVGIVPEGEEKRLQKDASKWISQSEQVCIPDGNSWGHGRTPASSLLN